MQAIVSNASLLQPIARIHADFTTLLFTIINPPADYSLIQKNKPLFDGI
jgi:hypothetical protein